MNKWLWFAFVALVLQGCKLGIDEEESTDIDEITVGSGEVRTISSSDVYNLSITGSNNILTLEDDISEINIVGGDNQITIVNDYSLVSISVSSDNNLVQWDSDLDTSVTSTLIERIKLLGEGHSIFVDTYYELEDNGTGNQVSGQQIAQP